MEPKVLTTNVLLHSRGKITYPIVTPLPDSADLAVVAIVTGTDTKIEFWIDVVHALKVSAADLLFSTRWIDDFAKCYEAEKGIDVRSNSKGWTQAILSAAIQQYERRYYMPPACMVGVFGQINRKMFWDAFTELYPGKQMAHFTPQERAEVATRCIQATPFWKTRKALGYTQLMFEVDALGHGEVLVRAFRDGLDRSTILELAETQKTHPELSKWVNWCLVSSPAPR